MLQDPPPVVRRAHKKSRLGCGNCKTRKIKCDEQHPVCGNCVMHYVGIDKCDFRPKSSGGGGSLRTANTNSYQLFQKRAARHLLPRTLHANLLDPFKTFLPTSIPQADYLMRHYLTTFVLRSFPWHPERDTNPRAKYWLPQISADVLLFHVTLQQSAVSLEALEQGKTDWHSKVLRAECISQLRNRVEDTLLADSDSTIMSVAMLIAVEYQRGDFRSLDLHMDGLARMIKLRGGLHVIRATNPMAAILVFWVSMIVKAEPQYTIEPPKYQSALPSLMYTDSTDLLDFEAHGVVSTVSCTLLELRNLSAQFNMSLEFETPKDALSVLIKICFLLQSLLSSPLDTQSDSGMDCLSNSCRLAAALFVFLPLRCHFPDPTLMINGLIHQLRTSISSVISSDTVERTLLLWLLSVGAVLAAGMPERVWFIGHLVVLVRDLEISSWQQMRVLLERVIWQHIFCEKPFQLLWTEIHVKKESL